jgi:hypothetical protein
VFPTHGEGCVELPRNGGAEPPNCKLKIGFEVGGSNDEFNNSVANARGSHNPVEAVQLGLQVGRGVQCRLASTDASLPLAAAA